ncbi:hypothetical protein [Herbaspirillum sp.]|uniref:hypothetical protein n=1 Tax=Herbaspirillum sp. TaxID=1890675 RepID=UPI00257F96D1|nr:hypothetical protein [Herbaspirillum sp.]|tara:strand:- start:10707 stop:11108 length:402 start_codon:yes stop_codon:yes gene_type:complete
MYTINTGFKTIYVQHKLRIEAGNEVIQRKDATFTAEIARHDAKHQAFTEKAAQEAAFHRGIAFGAADRPVIAAGLLLPSPGTAAHLSSPDRSTRSRRSPPRKRVSNRGSDVRSAGLKLSNEGKLIDVGRKTKG